jgi:C-terminal processing protease CtpA/Prc
MKKTRSLLKQLISLACLIFLFGNGITLRAQENDKKPKLTMKAQEAREYSLQYLDSMEKIIKERYYDPRFRGIDLRARIEAAKARVKTLEYNWQMYRVLVQVLMDFNDSHTYLLLPPRTDYFQYGFGVQMVGDECFITSVKTDSDARKQGVEVGDQIVLLGKFKPNRRDLWKMMYVLYKLDPADTLDLKIRKPDGTEKSLTVKAKTMTEGQFRAEQEKRLKNNQDEAFKCRELSSEVMACKFYSFAVEKNDIDKMMKQVAKYPKFILDLRGNGGGYVSIEQYLLSHFFGTEIKIADLITRKKNETRQTKPVGERQYKGEVAVLIDSDSASAAEVTARVLQLEQRARIYGDVSSGSVMTSIKLPFEVISPFADYVNMNVGMSVTVADVIMRDGSRLENAGVIPDELLLPSGVALAKKTDPVLAFAALKFGAKISPEEAGKFYFMVEKDENADRDERSEPK